MYLSQLRAKYNGYSAESFNNYFGKDVSIFLLTGNGISPAFGYDKEAKKSTKEVVGRYLETYFKGFGVQRVKLPKDFNIDGIKDLSQIELVDPEACEVNRQIFVRANGIKEVKD